MCLKRTIMIAHKNRSGLLTNTSDQIMLVDKSNEACVVECYYLVKLSPTPTQNGMSKGVLFTEGKCGNAEHQKKEVGVHTHTYIYLYTPTQTLLITENFFNFNNCHTTLGLLFQ